MINSSFIIRTFLVAYRSGAGLRADNWSCVDDGGSETRTRECLCLAYRIEQAAC
jgi:hypothetical protein